MKNFKLITTTAIIGYMLLVSVKCDGQDLPAFIEITDTIETAYDARWGDMVQKGFSISPEDVYDSVGVDRVIITKIYYLKPTYIKVKGLLIKDGAERVYLQIEQREYPEGRKGVDYRFSGYGYAY